MLLLLIDFGLGAVDLVVSVVDMILVWTRSKMRPMQAVINRIFVDFEVQALLKLEPALDDGKTCVGFILSRLV